MQSIYHFGFKDPGSNLHTLSFLRCLAVRAYKAQWLKANWENFKLVQRLANTENMLES